MNRCEGGGWLVGGHFALPVEPYEFLPDQRVFTLGCNHLLCSACGGPVVAGNGYRLASSQLDRVALIASRDWEGAVAHKWLERDDEWRTYLCACRGWSEDARRGLAHAEHWDEHLGERSPPWRCAGHERVTLPFTSDAITWRDVPDEVERITAVFLRDGHDAAPEHLRLQPASWLVRCHALLEHTPVAARIERVCSAALSSSDLKTRARAADFLRFLPRSEGAECAVFALLHAPASFIGVADPFAAARSSDERLQEIIGTRLLAGLASKDEVAAARALLDHAYVPNDFLARGLAHADRDWFFAAMPALLTRTPTPAMAMRLVASAARHDGPEIVDPIAGLARIVDPAVIKKAVQMFVAPRQRPAIVALL